MNMFPGFCMSQRNFVLLRVSPRFLKNVVTDKFNFLARGFAVETNVPFHPVKKIGIKKELICNFFSSEAIIVPSDVTIKSKI